MTQVCREPRRPQVATPTDRRQTAERLLRDAALVLHLTARLRGEIIRERKETARLLATAA